MPPTYQDSLSTKDAEIKLINATRITGNQGRLSLIRTQ